MEKVLGLDVSTSMTGWVILKKGQRIASGHVKPKGANIYEKAESIHEALKDIKKDHPEMDVWIEEPLTKFSKNKSSSATLSLLARFNGMISLMVFQLWGEPHHIWSEDARRDVGIEIPRKKKRGTELVYNRKRQQVRKQRTAKSFVLEKIVELDPSFEIRHNRTGNIADFVYDEADAYVVALAGYAKKTP